MNVEKKDPIQTFRKKSGNKKKVIIIVGVIAVALLLIIGNLRKQATALENAAAAMQQTDVVSNRSLIRSIGATGTIVSLDTKDISVSLIGTEVEKVSVAIGDSVEKGDTLLSFDTTDIEESLETAQNNLSKAEDRNELSKSDAERNVANAQRNYDTQVSSAKDALEEAEEQVFLIRDYIYMLENGMTTLTAAQVASELARVEAMLEPAETAYEKAKASYDNVLAAQENTLASAKSAQSSTLLSLDTSAQESQVELYEEQLENATLYAPISGIVTAVNYEAGETYNGGALITIQDCSSFEVEAQISEYDISDVKLGQKVLIKTNATGDEEMTGTINFISPTASTIAAGLSTGDVTYEVRITIDDPSDRLRLDMSASLSIILEEHENALTVPYNAIQIKDDGSIYVSVKDADGSFYDVAVTVVMESNYYTEITSDELTEGMEVLIIDSGNSSFFDLINSVPAGGRGGF